MGRGVQSPYPLSSLVRARRTVRLSEGCNLNQKGDDSDDQETVT